MATGGIQGIRDLAVQWRDIRWLARREMRQSWWGYPASAAYMAGMGALLAPQSEDGLGTVALEVPFLVLMLILTQAFFSWEYMSWENDRMSARLAFLRLLPIPLEVIVGSRMIRLISAAIFNVPAFFLPLWFLGEWERGPGSYVGFVLFWTGISTLATGYALCMEMAKSLRRYVLTNIGIMAVLIPLVIYLGLAHDIWAVRWSADIAADHPVLLGVGGLIVGVIGYLALGVVARNLLARRELTP
jgi:hypothetical protein